MTITDDSTGTFTTTGTKLDAFWKTIKDRKTVAGGGHKDKIVGRRFVAKETIRVTEDEFNDLIVLITNQSEAYFYTPTITPGFLTADFFPMQVSIEPPEKEGQAGGGSKRFYVELEFESTEYL